MHTNCLKLLDMASILASKVFPVPANIALKQHWMQACAQPKCMQVLDADNVLHVFNAPGGCLTVQIFVITVSYLGDIGGKDNNLNSFKAL